MWHDMFVVQIPILEKILRTVAVYILIVVIFRITGKRSMASLNTMDFVVMFLLSNVVQNAIIGNDNSLLGGAIGAVVLVVTDNIFDRLAYSFRAFRWLIEGNPTQVITDGNLNLPALKQLGMRKEELDHAIRIQNGDDVSEVGSGVLEPSGQLVLTLKPEEQSATSADVAGLNSRLDRIEALLRSAKTAPIA